MRILQLKNPDNISPFAPEWSYYILEAKLEDVKIISDLKNLILLKEKEIISNTPVPTGDNGNTSLGPYSLTSRFSYFNLLEWRFDHEEVMVLYHFIRDHYHTFLNMLEYEIPESSIQCWANVLRKGEQIKVHRHNTAPHSFLSGNMTIQAENTQTHYYVSEVYDPEAYPFYSSDNQPGDFNIFQSHMLHDTDMTESADPRISIAFDIELGDLTRIKGKKFIKF